MLERVLNKLGLYTRRQMLEIEIELNAFKERNGKLALAYDVKEAIADNLNRKVKKLEESNKKLIASLKASEEAKAEANRRAIKLAKELNELKLKYARRVKGRR